MLLIDCPHCGPRAQSEFVYDRTSDAIVTIDMPAEAAVLALYSRANPRGVDDELWQHRFGCRQWLVLRRHRTTHAIENVTVR